MRFIQAAQAASNPERFKSARLFLEITLPPVIKLGVGRLSATEERAPARILLRVKDPAKDLAEEIAQMNKVKRPQDKVFIVSPTEQTASFGERAAEGARSGIFLLGIDESVGSKLTAANLKAMSGNLSYCRVLIDAAWLDEESGLRRSPDLFRALQALEDYDGSDFKTEFYFTLGRVVEKLLAIPFRLAEISRLEPLKNALIAIQA